MLTIYGKTLEDYKRSDPDGAFGFWMDLTVVSFLVIGCLSPFVLIVGFIVG